MVEKAGTMFGEEFEIRAVGGIFTGSDVLETLTGGASTVEIYAALAYRGLKTSTFVESISTALAQ
ncbi:MAG: hypothetical protein QXO30_04800 [Candidatus Caldarchaeum sp.]